MLLLELIAFQEHDGQPPRARAAIFFSHEALW